MTKRTLCLAFLLPLVIATKSSATKQWRWLPEDEHPCTIARMSLDEVYEVFGYEGVPANYSTPLIIVTGDDNSRNDEIRRLTGRREIVKAFPPGFEVTLSSSNSFSEHRRTITLEAYLNEISLNSSTTYPDQKSSELWYLFGETYSSEWKDLLKAYQWPPCQACTEEYVALSFGIGNRGSGVQWHIHGPGYSETLHGRKHWVLYPPHHSPPNYHPDQSSRNWMEYVYTNASLLLAVDDVRVRPEEGHTTRPGQDERIIAQGGRPYECTLSPKEMIFFPDRWYHATINCDPYTAFVSTFTSDHLFLLDKRYDEPKNRKVQQKSGLLTSEL